VSSFPALCHLCVLEVPSQRCNTQTMYSFSKHFICPPAWQSIVSTDKCPVQSHVFHLQCGTSATRLNDLSAMLENAQQSPLDMCKMAFIATPAALHQTGTAELIWRPPRPGVSEDEWIDSCGWREGEARVAWWILSKNAYTVRNGSVHLPSKSQLWLYGRDLRIEDVEFSGVMKLSDDVETIRIAVSLCLLGCIVYLLLSSS
jgi:hypothetical protein